MDVLEAIRIRRSIRRYKSRPVKKAKLERILEAGRLSPSAANRQCGREIVHYEHW
jgi:nitroreductase